MPIFSSQLGKIESQNTEQSIKVMANHLRKIQEELEYRLMHLDSTNVTEIDARETTILIEDGEGNYSELIRTTKELRSKIGDAEGNLSTLQQTANGILGQVATANGNLAEWSITAQGILGQVSDANANLTVWQQTADSILGQVADANGNLTLWQQTADSINQQVKDANANFGQLEVTATSLAGRVGNLETGQSTMLKLAADGVTVTNALGNTVKITGSCIDFGSATDSNTIEGKIAAAANKAASASSAASSAASAASSAYDRADDAYDLADSAYDLANSVQLPGYIEKTYIDATHMRSPDIYGGMFYATGRGVYGEPAFYLYDGWDDPGSDVHGSVGLLNYNKVGFLSYDDNGAGTDAEAQKRVLLTSLNGTALKLQAAANMSLEAGGKIYVMSPTVFSTNLILTRGVNYGSSRPTTGTPGQLYFEIA